MILTEKLSKNVFTNQAELYSVVKTTFFQFTHDSISLIFTHFSCDIYPMMVLETEKS